MLISEITLGEMVYAYNEETGEIGLYPVTDYFIHEDPVIVYLTIDGELIETTPEHPFYTAEGAWVDAGDLQPGDQIRTRAWTLGTVDAIEILDQTQLMYNFTVATAHTYFIGNNAWLVHNCNWHIGSKSVKEIAGTTNIFPSDQGSVTKSRVERYAKAMVEGNFNWNGMREPIKFARNPDGSLSIRDGHHRFLAAQLTGTPIPWNNPKAVEIRDFEITWPVTTTWDRIKWDGF